MLTLVSSISVDSIQSHVPMCEWHHKGQQSLSLALRRDFTYINPFLMVKLFLTRNSALPSSEVDCSPMHSLSRASLFWGVTLFFMLNRLRQAANNASSCCASSQLVTCIDANLRAWACVSLSKQSHSALKGQLMRTSPLSVVLVTAPSSKDRTVSRSCRIGTQLSASAAALSDPFWYSKLNS